LGDKDIGILSCRLFFSHFPMRVPLKFGSEISTTGTFARTEITVCGAENKEAHGWGETPLSVNWAWPSSLSFEYRLSRFKDFCIRLSQSWNRCIYRGHPMEIGRQFIDLELKEAWEQFNRENEQEKAMPWLAALVCNSLFDIALHDAYGIYHGISTWDIYTEEFMNRDLSWYYSDEHKPVFVDRYPGDYLVRHESVSRNIPVWHLVGAKDIVTDKEITGNEPDDGYPVKLKDWIVRDGLYCLKIKLTGIDGEWDYQRIRSVGKIALENDVEWLSADFNCTVTDPSYVCDILDRLMIDDPKVYKLILYVEQPFPYEIKNYPLDVHSVSARKPLFMDESAHDWEHVEYGRKLGWTGVALKTCKTITGALLSLCWAKMAGMPLMVQDLTNPMFSQIPHVGLGAHAGTIMGVESNGMQFYPAASDDEARIHPGLYKRRKGCLDLSTLGPIGFGYRAEEIFMATNMGGLENKWKEA
jgi:L-alanine-DL-glutamate epimerase-like enolase superfamily enzyme